MKIENLIELLKLTQISSSEKNTLGGEFIGQYVIIRTYSAGVWFGKLDQKLGNEVILADARRMYYWKANQGISLSACALYGVSNESKIVEAVDKIWLEAIEILSCTDKAILTLRDADNVEAE